MTDFAPSASVKDEITTFLVSSPIPKEIIDFKVSDSAQHRLRYLLDANRNDSLTDEESSELEMASNANHFMMMLKAKARLSVKNDIHS